MIGVRAHAHVAAGTLAPPDGEPDPYVLLLLDQQIVAGGRLQGTLLTDAWHVGDLSQPLPQVVDAAQGLHPRISVLHLPHRAGAAIRATLDRFAMAEATDAAIAAAKLDATRECVKAIAQAIGGH